VTAWWWLSFADPELPSGQQFLGAAIVRGRTVLDAVMRAHSLGCNPGGEVKVRPVPERLLPASDRLERLLSPAEVDEVGQEMNRLAAN
jgi:hypothetical protein